MLTFLDFFSGIGGFRTGLTQCDFKCVGHCEIDKFADRSYRAIHEVKEDEWFASDITTVRAEDVPRADIWCAGFPCQDISVAGHQRGLKGNRSGLFYEIIRLLEGKNTEDRPDWIILENVKNLLSINGGRDFATILSEMAEIGYDLQYQLLNSKDFLVPQNRERVYIIATRHFENRSGRKVFPIGGSNEKALKQLIGGSQGQRVYDPSGLSTTLTSYGGGQGAKTGLYLIDLNKKARITEIARCIKARYNSGFTNRSGDNSGVFICPRAVLTPNRLEKRQNGRRMKECGEPMFALTTQDRHGVMLCNCKKEECPVTLQVRNGTKKGYDEAKYGDCLCLAYPESKTRRGRVGKGCSQTLDTSCNMGAVMRCGRIRKLTPLECWRLQGFSDELFEKARKVNSDAQLYKQAGNSVTVIVVYSIGMKIREIMDKEKSEDEGDYG